MEPDERKRLRQGARRSADDWAWILLPMGAGAGFGLLVAAIIGWLWSDAPNLRPMLVTCCAILGAYPSWRLHRLFATEASKIKGAVVDTTVEVIHVKSAACVEQKPYNSEGPIYYFDVAPNQILFIWGQWIYDAHGPNGTVADNDYAEFPSTEFTIHRLRDHGRVLRLEVTGEVIKPSRTIKWKDIPLADLKDCEILDGSLSDLAGAMARHRTSNIESGRRE
jgi:hypothetical protein